MPDYKDLLLAKAFKIVPGIEYNRVAYELRAKEGESLLIYEIVLANDKTWDYLRDIVYPKLAKYLKEKGLHPSSGEGLIISIFIKDSVFLLKGTDFFKIFCEMEGLNQAAFHFRVLRWLAN
ncbi:MAG: STAUR_1299 family protein [Thermodesulfobacteriota bacterium]